MDSLETHEDFDSLDEFEPFQNIRNMSQKELRAPRPLRPFPHPQNKRAEAQTIANLIEQSDGQEAFGFSYKASYHEREWISDSLGPFYEGQWLDDVLRLIKGGKEAHVYQCQANPSVAASHADVLDNDYIAAKVYRPRKFRNLRKDHLYREGRELLDEDGHLVKDDGVLHAVQQRTTFGRRAMHTSWIEHEYKTLQLLHAAGADVPIPLERGYNTILMSFVGGDYMPAPTLSEVQLEPGEALLLYQRTIHNIDLMLEQNRVHGDLSAYNILYWDGEITLIDFPQAIDPHVNSNALSIFARDVRRVCDYFARQGIKSKPRRITADLWTAHGHRLSPDVHPGLLDGDDADDRAFWKRISRA
jgi:RIO kinase 1